MYSYRRELIEYEEFCKFIQEAALMDEEKLRDTFSVLFNSPENRGLKSRQLLHRAEEEIQELSCEEKAYWMGLIFLLHKDYLYFGDRTEDKITTILANIKDPAMHEQCLRFTNLLNPEYITAYHETAKDRKII